MSEKLIFDYYYGKEADQFTFYRIPKMLIKDNRFSGLSSDAKILYGLMLDRMSLSVMNEWQDDEDRTYVIYTIEQIMEDLGCAKQKAVKILSELDSKNGIGLIEKVRRGLGKADIIYVKNFVGIERVDDSCEAIDLDDEGDAKSGEIDTEKTHKITEVRKSNFKKYENQTSGSVKIKLQEVPESKFSKYDNQTSGSMKTKLQEVPKSNSSNNYISDTESNNTDNNYNNVNENNPIISNQAVRTGASTKNEQKRLMDEMVVTTWLIKDNISYDDLITAHPLDKKKIDELVDIMVEVCVSTADTVRIAGEDKPTEVVRSRFEKIDYSAIEYVLYSLKTNTTKVHNIKNYLITTLYNSSMTIDNYYSAEVNHDMYGSD